MPVGLTINEQVENLFKLTGRYYVAYQTLCKGVPLETFYNHNDLAILL